MKDTILTDERDLWVPLLPYSISSPVNRIARSVILGRMKKISRGCIRIVERDGVFECGRSPSDDPLAVTVTVHSPVFFTSLLLGGTIGAAEAYMADLWSTDDLAALIRIVLRNRHVLADTEGGLARLTAPMHKSFHLRRKNTRQGSLRNITAHYDLGNDFYELFLDETLTYSCGIFEQAASTLAEASIAKYDRICRKLSLGPSDHVLEIGSGWGGFALHAAGRYGCRVTTTTISAQQFELAKKRIQAAGLSDRVTLLFSDYRDLGGVYDKLVSIEMIEAVGHHFFDTFFRCCSDRLKPDGMMLLQAITITDQVYESHKRGVDFIKRYIFPGSCIPSVSAICHSVASATDMKLFHMEDITPHYCRTLRTWRERFLSRVDDVRRLGYPDHFVRMWEFYLSYCEAGFAERYLGDAQMIFIKPLSRPTPILPSLNESASGA